MEGLPRRSRITKKWDAPGFSRELDEPAEAASGERLRGIGASAELADQLVDRLLPVGGVLSGPLPAPSDDDAAALVLEFRRTQVLGAAGRLVGVEVENPLLQVLRQRFQPGADDVLEIPVLHVLEVRLAEHAPVGDMDRRLDPFALTHSLQRRDQALSFMLRSREHLAADRQPVGRGHQRKQDLGPGVPAVLGEAELAQPVRIDRLEVQRRAVEEDNARRLRQKPPRRPGREILHAFDRFPVQPVHHPADPLHRDRNSEIALQPPGRPELAVRIGDARRRDVPKRPARRAVPLGRQQPVEAQLAMDGSAGLVEAGRDPMLLAGLLDDDRRTFLRLLPPGLDRQVDELLLRKQGGLPLAPDSDLEGLSELHELLQLGVGLGDADVADDALARLPALAHGFDELDGLPGASGPGFDAEEHEAIPDSLLSEPLARFPGFHKIIVLEALHFPLEHDRAGIPLRATPRKAETALKSSQTVEVRRANDKQPNSYRTRKSKWRLHRPAVQRWGRYYMSCTSGRIVEFMGHSWRPNLGVSGSGLFLKSPTIRRI